MCSGRKELDMSHNALNTMCEMPTIIVAVVTHEDGQGYVVRGPKGGAA